MIHGKSHLFFGVNVRKLSLRLEEKATSFPVKFWVPQANPEPFEEFCGSSAGRISGNREEIILLLLPFPFARINSDLRSDTAVE